MGLEPIRNYPLISKISLSTISAYPWFHMDLDRFELSTSRLSSVHSSHWVIGFRLLNPMRIELIFLTWKVNVLPLDEGFFTGCIGTRTQNLWFKRPLLYQLSYTNWDNRARTYNHGFKTHRLALWLYPSSIIFSERLKRNYTQLVVQRKNQK